MRLVARCMWVFVLGISPIVGCNDVTSTAPLAFVVTAWDPEPSNQVALAGAEICELETKNCVMTDAGGNATLELPVGQTAYTIVKEGYGSLLGTEVIPDQGALLPTKVNMLPDQHVAEEHEQVMSPYPMRGTGTIIIEILPGLAGVTFDLVNATGTAWFLDENFHWRTDFTATTSRGVGGFTEVTPGEFEINLAGTAQGCHPTIGWPGNVENTITIPIREGYLSYSRLACAVTP